MESGGFGESVIVAVSGQPKKIHLSRDSFQNAVRHNYNLSLSRWQKQAL